MVNDANVGNDPKVIKVDTSKGFVDLRAQSYRKYAKQRAAERKGFRYVDTGAKNPVTGAPLMGAIAGDITVSKGGIKESNKIKNITYTASRGYKIATESQAIPISTGVYLKSQGKDVSRMTYEKQGAVYIDRRAAQQIHAANRFQLFDEGLRRQETKKEQMTGKSIDNNSSVLPFSFATPETTPSNDFATTKLGFTIRKNTPEEVAYFSKSFDYFKSQPMIGVPLFVGKQLLTNPKSPLVALGEQAKWFISPQPITIEKQSETSVMGIKVAGLRTSQESASVAESLSWIYAGGFSPKEASIERVPLSSSEKANIKADFSDFLKSENIKSGGLITQADAMKIQSFFLKYNREGVATEVSSLFETRLTRAKGASIGGTRAVSVELKLRPIESIEIFGYTKRGAGIEQSGRYAVVKKGEAEFVKPQDINQFDFLQLVGEQKLVTKQTGSKIPQDFTSIEYAPSQLQIGFENKGAVSPNRRFDLSSSKNINEIMPASRFNELVNLRGAFIDVGDFVGRVDSLDFARAKIYRARTVRKADTGLYPSVTLERTNLEVRGFDTKLGKERSPFTDNLRIGRTKGSRYNPNQLEDLRFRLEYADKKMLTAENIKSVMEFEGGYQVKVYTWDKGIRGFKDIELYIPKKGFYQAKAATTFASINKKYSPSSTISGENVAGGTATILEPPKSETKSPNLATITEPPKSKGKGKTKVELPSQVYGGSYYEYPGESASKPSPAATSVYEDIVKPVTGGRSRSSSSFFMVSRFDTGAKSGLATDTKAKVDTKIDTKIEPSTSIGSKNFFKLIQQPSTGQRRATKQATDISQIQSQSPITDKFFYFTKPGEPEKNPRKFFKPWGDSGKERGSKRGKRATSSSVGRFGKPGFFALSDLWSVSRTEAATGREAVMPRLTGKVFKLSSQAYGGLSTGFVPTEQIRKRRVKI